MQLNNSRGSTMVLILMLLFASASIGYIALDVIRAGVSSAMDEQARIEAEALASDILELTKYQLFYENVIYVDALGPWNHSGARGAALQKLMASGMGSSSEADADMLKACGGYDAKGKQVGTFKVKGVPVFCPFYLRSNLLSSVMLDQMVLKPLLDAGVVKQDKPGQYYLDIVYFDKDAGIDNLSSGSNLFLQLDGGQALIKAAKNYLDHVSARIRIYTDNAGFSSATSERYIEVSTEVALSGVHKMIHFKRRQSLLNYPSSPRDFALFVMYPTKADGVTPTKLWSESMQIAPTSTIQGRVFFNGNIDVALANLPTFTETVVVTGDFKPPLSIAQRQTLSKKFLKGLITNYSAPRFLFSGNCSATDPALTIANGTNFPCVNSAGTAATINDYMTGIADACITVPVSYGDGILTVDCSAQVSTCAINCGPPLPPAITIVSGPRKRVTLSGSYAFISAPVAVLNNSAKNIYGTIFGGFFSSPNKVNIYSMSAVTVGLPGIGSPDTLNNYSALFQSGATAAGISVPLANMPIVYEEGVSR
ncbi:MAG: hypothetical protein ACXVA9_03455 [Bdellovibrionales bacterium]